MKVFYTLELNRNTTRMHNQIGGEYRTFALAKAECDRMLTEEANDVIQGHVDSSLRVSIMRTCMDRDGSNPGTDTDSIWVHKNGKITKLA